MSTIKYKNLYDKHSMLINAFANNLEVFNPKNYKKLV